MWTAESSEFGLYINVGMTVSRGHEFHSIVHMNFTWSLTWFRPARSKLCAPYFRFGKIIEYSIFYFLRCMTTRSRKN